MGKVKEYYYELLCKMSELDEQEYIEWLDRTSREINIQTEEEYEQWLEKKASRCE